jgi:muscarinic acetylcholine receptor
MAIGWFVGFTIAAIPVIWNKWENAKECEFDQIFYPWYMVGVITPVFSLVWFCMLFVYCRIWREASKQVKQLRTTGQQEGTSDWKSVQVSLEMGKNGSRNCIIELHMEIAFSLFTLAM